MSKNGKKKHRKGDAMKRAIIFLTTLIMMLLIVACSADTQTDVVTESQNENTTTENTESEESDATSETNSEAVESLETDTKYADLIPKPEDVFKNGEVSIVDSDGGSAYIFQVRNFEDGEYESYISQCKEMGFTDVSYESENDGGKMFGAYTEDGTYWVEVLLGNDNGILAVTCKESTKNK